MLTAAAAWIVALAVTVFLSNGAWSRTRTWSATVTPLASIIGSGFLVCGPVLAREFGGAAALAMMLLLALAYAMGAVMRFNIANAEPLLQRSPFHSRIAWCARAAQAMLAIAYAVSVAYYLKLLAEFCLHDIPLAPRTHEAISRIGASGIIGLFALLAVLGGHERLERLAHATVSLKIGVIAGMLVALAAYWLFRWNQPVVVPSARMDAHSLPLLLGLVVTVQGFETSRYMGHSYDPELRIRAMRYAQWISSAIYVAFLVLLTPFLGQASRSQGVAGILEVMRLAAPFLSALVLIGAASSQLSAAVADTIGSAGLASEASRRRLGVRTGALAAAALAAGVVWLTDPFQIIAVASRAFAAFYAMQCVLAVLTSRRTGGGGAWAQAGFIAVGAACVAAALAGAPAE